MYRSRGTSQSFACGRLVKPGTQGVVYVPGSATNDLEPFTSPYHAQAAAIAETYPFASLASDSLWGNDTHKTRVGDARTFLGTSGATTTTVHLFAISMGALGALNWARANPSLVRSIALVLPAIDLGDIHSNNRGSYAAAISTAYGGAPPSTHDPSDHAADYTAIPTRIWYATDDTICLPATVTTFASAAGATATSLGAVGHSPTSAGAASSAEILDFFGEH